MKFRDEASVLPAKYALAMLDTSPSESAMPVPETAAQRSHAAHQNETRAALLVCFFLPNQLRSNTMKHSLNRRELQRPPKHPASALSFRHMKALRSCCRLIQKMSEDG